MAERDVRPNFVYPVGTPLRLASGSPKLTVVDNCVETGRVTVAWINEEGQTEEMTANSYCFDPWRKYFSVEAKPWRPLP